MFRQVSTHDLEWCGDASRCDGRSSSVLYDRLRELADAR